MPKAKVYDITGTQTGEMELSDAVFGIEPSEPSMHSVVTAHLSARRQGTQSSKTRSEVSGGGIKPWRQKGTGRARQGSTRSPQWTHGGIAFAPKPRSYVVSINKKVRRLAMLSALSVKAGASDIFVIDKLEMDKVKTKDFAAFLQKLGVNKALVVLPETRENVVLSARNLPNVKTLHASVINVYDILKYGALVMDKEAVAKIEEVYGA